MRFLLTIVLISFLTGNLQASPVDTACYQFSYGFSLGANHSLLTLKLASPLPQGDALRVSNKPGLDLSVFAQVDFGESIRVRPQLALSFLNKSLIYSAADGEDTEYAFPNAYLELPLHFHFTHQTITQNISVIFGIRHSRNLDSVLDSDPSLRDRFNSFEIGLGKDFDLGHFHVAPEVLLSLGTDNIYRFSSSPELDAAVDQLFVNRLSFRLVFFGKA